MFEQHHTTRTETTASGSAPTAIASAKPGPAAATSQRNLHLYDRLGVVVKYYKALAAVVVLVVAGMMHNAYTTIPLYRAQARIYIEEEHAPSGDFKEAYLSYQDPEPYYQTQYRILQGRDLARRAVRRLKLEQVPEFNGKGPTPTKLSQFLAFLKDKVMAPFGGSSTPPAADGPLDENAMVGAFLSRIQVAPVRSSRLVDVVFTAADPVLAAKAVNTLAEEYVAQNLEFRLQNTEKTLGWLESEVTRQQQVVQDRERTLAEYRERRNALSLEGTQNIVVSRLNQVNDAVGRARTQRVQKEALYRQVTTAPNREALSSIVANPNVQQLRTRLADLQQNKARLTERYFEQHPEVIKVNAMIADTQRQIDQEVDKAIEAIKNDYETALAEERSLTHDLEQEKAAATDLNRKSIDYSVLEREAESDRQVYESLLQREKELRVVSNSRANNVRLLDSAEVPGAPYTPDIKRAWMIAIILGLGCGVAAAFGIDYLDDTVKTPDDIRWRLKVHFLGLVPNIRGNARPLLTDTVPPTFGEAFRALRTALVIRTGDADTRILAMTSAQPLEGKTTTAVNTALALAIGGARVLVIDADMRRPSVHKTLRIENEKGLSELLRGTARTREVVRQTAHPNLLVMTAGAPPTNPSELLGSDRMKALLRQLDAGPFDWVVIDTPPVLAVTDAVILAPLVSSVVFVVGAEMTRWRLAERAIEVIQAGNPRSLSAVLNRVDFERNRYYYSRYYGQHYYTYYAEDAPKAKAS